MRRLADWGCSGYVTLWREHTQTMERRWLLLNEHRGTLTVYENEREEAVVAAVDTMDICRCRQDGDDTAQGSNTFLVSG